VIPLFLAGLAGVVLTVTGGDAATVCPAEADVRRLAEGLHLGPSAPPSHAYRVSFERSGAGYRAEVVDETAQRTRTLSDRGPGCAAIARAVAVVLATMWDSEQEEEAQPPPPPEPTPAPTLPAPPPPEPPPQAAPAERSTWRWNVAAGGGAAVGIVRALAPVIVAAVGPQRDAWSFAAGVIGIPPQQLGLGPGSVTVDLLAASARGCFLTGHAATLGLCVYVLGGAVRAGGSGYDTNAVSTRPWLAPGLEGFIDVALVAPLRVRAAVMGLVPLHAEAFTVGGAGVAYDTPPAGALFTLALEVGP
jgi:hypothetical protein